MVLKVNKNTIIDINRMETQGFKELVKRIILNSKGLFKIIKCF